MTPLPPSQQHTVVISPRGGAAGTEVTVGMAGLPPLTRVRISFGSMIAYEVIERTVTDMDGNFTMIVTVPTWVEVDELHYVLVSYGRGLPRQRSDGFHVTAPDGTARVEGEIRTDSGGCLGSIRLRDRGHSGRILLRGTGNSDRGPGDQRYLTVAYGYLSDPRAARRSALTFALARSSLLRARMAAIRSRSGTSRAASGLAL